MVFERLHWVHLLAGLVVLVAAAFAVSPASEDVRTDIDPSTGELGVIQLNGPIAYDNGIRDSSISPGTLEDLTTKAVSRGADAILYEI
ncbi:MAG: hypothetical protein ABEI97_00525, partial [Candidatus Nanohaloarchaea archaeon]